MRQEEVLLRTQVSVHSIGLKVAFTRFEVHELVVQFFRDVFKHFVAVKFLLLAASHLQSSDLLLVFSQQIFLVSKVLLGDKLHTVTQSGDLLSLHVSVAACFARQLGVA